MSPWTPAERVQRLILLVCAIIVLLDLFVWRP
jgi:hypothetical protein